MEPLKSLAFRELRECSSALIVLIVLMVAFSLSACGKGDYGDGEDLDPTRLATENDSTQTNDTTTDTLEIYIQGAQWEDNDTISF